MRMSSPVFFIQPPILLTHETASYLLEEEWEIKKHYEQGYVVEPGGSTNREEMIPCLPETWLRVVRPEPSNWGISFRGAKSTQ
jgi:hypothetical protein